MFTSRQSNEIIIMLYVDATGGTLDRSACISFFCVQKPESLLWASAAIDQLIEDAWASPRPDKLEIRLHVTRPAPAACRGFSPVSWQQNKFYEKKNQSLSIKSTHFVQVEILLSRKYPNLLRRLEYGRPKWKELFTSWKETYSRYTVEFFSHIIF